MAQYRVKTLNAALAVEEHMLEAIDEAEVQRMVLASGARLVSATQLRRGLQRDSASRAFRLPIFNQQLSSLLDAGQPVVDALEILGRNDVRGTHRRVYDTLLQGLRNGRQLSDAMLALPSVFPSLYVAMIRSSETTGTVKTSVRRYMQYQKQIDEIRNKLISAAIYPAVLLLVGFLVVLFLMLYVVPRFSTVFDEVSSAKHVSAGFVQVWGGFVRHHTILAWGGTAAMLAGLAVTVLHPGLRATVLRRLLAVPWIGERAHVVQLGRIYRTLSMLLRGGLSVMQALRMTTDALPMHLRGAMAQSSEQVAQGHTISSSMSRTGLGTEVAYRLLLAGESSGNLEEMMEKIADFYDQETATWVDTAGRLIEPALMVGIGLIIGAVVLMLYMPIFDLANAV